MLTRIKFQGVLLNNFNGEMDLPSAQIQEPLFYSGKVCWYHPQPDKHQTLPEKKGKKEYFWRLQYTLSRLKKSKLRVIDCGKIYKQELKLLPCAFKHTNINLKFDP